MVINVFAAQKILSRASIFFLDYRDMTLTLFLSTNTLCLQVRVYDLASMSCSYVLAGHTGIVLCLDTCIASSGNTLIVTGSKDNSVSSPSLYIADTLLIAPCVIPLPYYTTLL